MQRLFSTFPNGWPGRGLLLQRFAAAAFLFCSAFGDFRGDSQFTLIFPHVIGAGAGILLLLGLWTPISGTLIALVEVWVAFSTGWSSGVPIVLAILGTTLAMIGPGAWSVDARLFGRKHFEIPKR